jgi:methylated-DNA-protein-cysteine methyltransferase-like protein
MYHTCMTEKTHFTELVCELVSIIPSGQVASYGQIAVLIGQPRAARQVGGVAHFGPETLPWHRVVRSDGGLASGYPGGMAAQRAHLETEGIVVSDDFTIDMSQYQWRPNDR